MPPGRLTTLTLRLTPADQQTLRAWQRSTTLPAGLARRGRLLLLRAEGMPICTIAATVGISRRFVYKWVRRFLAQGLAGLADKPRRGSRAQAAPGPPGRTAVHRHRWRHAPRWNDGGSGGHLHAVASRPDGAMRPCRGLANVVL